MFEKKAAFKEIRRLSSTACFNNVHTDNGGILIT